MSGLRKQLGFAQGLALYLAAVLGTGVLVIPSLAYQEAGPASLVSWGTMAFLGLALAWTFASVGSRAPDAGGVQAIVGKVFGPRARDILSWLVLFSVPVGAVAGSHIFAEHFVRAAHLPAEAVPWIAWGGLALVTAANIAGLRVSANAQLTLSAVLTGMLLLLVVASLPRMEATHFRPFAPEGIGGVGEASVLIFWSFLGWEAIAHLAEEFREPSDMLRAAFAAAVGVGVLYFLVALVLIGTGAVAAGEGEATPMATLAAALFGPPAGDLTAGLAAAICLGTMNAYSAGLSRLTYAMARDGALSSALARLDGKAGTPRRALLFLLGLYTLAIGIRTLGDLPMRLFFLIPNAAFLALYTLGCAASARFLSGKARVAAWVSAAACLSMLPFATEILFYPAVVAITAVVYLAWARRRGSRSAR
jgi:amino acid efflux transporter